MIYILPLKMIQSKYFVCFACFFLEDVDRELDELLAVAFGSTEGASAEIDLNGRKQQTRNRERFGVGGDELIDSDAVVEGAVLVAVGLDGDASDGLAIFGVVVADEEGDVVTEGEELLGRFEEGLGAAAGEVSAGIAHFRVEDGVADESELLRFAVVGAAGGGVAGGVENLEVELADVEGVALLEEAVELLAVGGGVGGGVEDGDPVVEDLGDVFADHDGDLLSTVGLFEGALKIVGGGQVVGVDVGFDEQVDLNAEFLALVEDGVGRLGGPAAGLDVEVEERVDDSSLLGFLAVDDVGKGTGFLFVEVFDASHCVCDFLKKKVFKKEELEK